LTIESGERWGKEAAIGGLKRLSREDLSLIALTKAGFAGRYVQVMKSLVERLRGYAERQDEDVVHDFRTSVRRAQATVRLFPSELRRKRLTRKFLRCCRAAGKVSSQLRDIDIIKARLMKLPQSDPRDSFLSELDGRRLALLRDARRTAKALSRNLLKEEFDRGLNAKQLEKRFRKVAGRLVVDVDSRLAVVLEDATKKKELHLLRMDCKKLRYTLEAGRKTAYREKLLRTLEESSDALGGIHDWDTVTAYLMEKPRRAEPLIELAAEKRDLEYQKFVKRAR